MTATSVLISLFGFALGYLAAHAKIAQECRRLGAFYVGRWTFRCTAVEDRGDVKTRSASVSSAPSSGNDAQRAE